MTVFSTVCSRRSSSNALLQLKTLSGAGAPQPKVAGLAGPAEKRAKSNLTDCCICAWSHVTHISL
jgi:hypothetical protein